MYIQTLVASLFHTIINIQWLPYADSGWRGRLVQYLLATWHQIRTSGQLVVYANILVCRVVLSSLRDRALDVFDWEVYGWMLACLNKLESLQETDTNYCLTKRAHSMSPTHSAKVEFSSLLGACWSVTHTDRTISYGRRDGRTGRRERRTGRREGRTGRREGRTGRREGRTGEMKEEIKS